MPFLFSLFFVWIFLNFAVSYFSKNIVSYLGLKNFLIFPYSGLLSGLKLPPFIKSFANFDGMHYITIALQGYSQFQEVFFPTYPFLLKFTSSLLKDNFVLAGLLISNVSFLAALFVLKKYLDLIGDKSKFTWALIFILTFPTSFFFNAVYTESLFFLFLISALYFMKKDKYFLGSFFAFFAGATKVIGVFLSTAFLIPVWFSKTGIKEKVMRSAVAICAPLLGFLTYSFYLYKVVGDPLYFFHTQSSLNLGRSTQLIILPQVLYRYFRIFTTAQFNFQYVIAAFEISVFLFFAVILTLDFLKNSRNRNFDRLGLNIFSFVNLLLPTFTGTFLSIPRFALLSLSAFIYLAEIKNFMVKVLISSIFLILHILSLAFFAQGYFIS